MDFWLAETQSSLAEARAVHAALDGECKPLWLSFTLLDPDTEQSQPLLRSGESVEQAVLLALELGASALLFNCSQPESMGAALHSARQVLKKQARELPLGVYANAFPPVREDAQANDTLLDIRADLGPEAYLQWAQQWVEEGLPSWVVAVALVRNISPSSIITCRRTRRSPTSWCRCRHAVRPR